MIVNELKKICIINITFRALAPRCCRQFVTPGPSRSAGLNTLSVPTADRASDDTGGGRREDARELLDPIGHPI